MGVKKVPILGIFDMTVISVPFVCRYKSVKTIYRVEYRAMCDLLREYRERAGLTQDELADLLSDSLGWHKTQISKVERCERRIDVFETRVICTALNVPMSDFWHELEGRIV